MKKKLRGRAASLLGIVAHITFHNDTGANYIEALGVAINMELKALGLTEEEIHDASELSEYPEQERIEELVKNFKPEDTNWVTARPHTVSAYLQRLYVMSLIYSAKDPNARMREMSPAEYINFGAELAWHAYASDIDYVEITRKSMFGSIGGAGRLGKTYSLAKKAIKFAIQNGYDTADQIKSYFESEPTMDEIDLEIYFEHCEPNSFCFFDLTNSKMSRPLKITTLPSAISQVKASLKNS